MTTSITDGSLDPEHLFEQAWKYEECGQFKRAFLCSLLAARLGHAGSRINLGNFYSSGQGVRRNAKNAAYWYKLAYKNGDSSAAFNVAIDKKNEGDIGTAIRWFKKAVAMNDGVACIELAKIYLTSRGGKKRAADLLNKTQSLNRTEISDDSKEEAGSLLAGLMKPH